jgi:hypothetical protein
MRLRVLIGTFIIMNVNSTTPSSIKFSLPRLVLRFCGVAGSDCPSRYNWLLLCRSAAPRWSPPSRERRLCGIRIRKLHGRDLCWYQGEYDEPAPQVTIVLRAQSPSLGPRQVWRATTVLWMQHDQEVTNSPGIVAFVLGLVNLLRVTCKCPIWLAKGN